MKIAAISDIHGNLPALEAVLADIERRGVDVIVNLGDILSGPLYPVETADLLMAKNYPTICGNHERQVLTLDDWQMNKTDQFTVRLLRQDQKTWLLGLPATHWLSDNVFMCHGTPDSDLIYFLEDVDASGCHAAAREIVEKRAGSCAASLILCGHTHMPRHVQLSDGRHVVNPGSVGLQAYDDDMPLPHKMQVGAPSARYALISGDAAHWDVELIGVDYDWEAVARQADLNDRPDWAVALRTGYCM
jgi:predicted phosphodiesterase